MAYRARCELVDLEFVQFHPTLLYLNDSCHGLISEAVRGEGAYLVTGSGRRVMKDLHPMEDLAPRDIVSRAIFNELKNGEDVFLDISMVSNFPKRFPTIYENLVKSGLNLDRPLIPVVPGAHFHMGGVKTNENGETSIKQLFAIGEVACTGVHGANRLASNSLLEGMVFGEKVARYISGLNSFENEIEVMYQLPSNRKLPSKEEIQEIMMQKVGIVRTENALQEAINWFDFHLSIDEKESMGMNVDVLVRWNMLTVGRLIAQSALSRKESVGSHFLDIRGASTNQVIA
jgi:L-aspartate oxidase